MNSVVFEMLGYTNEKTKIKEKNSAAKK